MVWQALAVSSSSAAVVCCQVLRCNASLQRCVKDNYPIFAATSAATRFLDVQGKVQALVDAIAANEAALRDADKHEAPVSDDDEGGDAGEQNGSARPSIARMLDADAARGSPSQAGRSRSGSVARSEAGSVSVPAGNGSPGSKVLSADQIKHFAKRAKRATMALIDREAKEAAQQKAVADLHKQFGVGLDAKLSRSPAAKHSPLTPRMSTLNESRVSTPGSFSSPRSRFTVTNGLSARHRLSRLGSPSTPAGGTPVAPRKVRGLLLLVVVVGRWRHRWGGCSHAVPRCMVVRVCRSLQWARS